MTRSHCWKTRNEQINRFTKAVFFSSLPQTEMLQIYLYYIMMINVCNKNLSICSVLSEIFTK